MRSNIFMGATVTDNLRRKIQGEREQVCNRLQHVELSSILEEDKAGELPYFQPVADVIDYYTIISEACSSISEAIVSFDNAYKYHGPYKKGGIAWRKVPTISEFINQQTNQAEFFIECKFSIRSSY